MEGGNMRLEYRQGSRKILNSASSIVEISWNWKILINKKKKSLYCIQTSSVATCHIQKYISFNNKITKTCVTSISVEMSNWSGD